jgi:serine/threonine-protein phosphatase 2A regulatory subunit B
LSFAGNGEIQWCFSQVKGTLDDDVTEGKFLSHICDVFTLNSEILVLFI